VNAHVEDGVLLLKSVCPGSKPSSETCCLNLEKKIRKFERTTYEGDIQ
jgi:hypothetical protein